MVRPLVEVAPETLYKARKLRSEQYTLDSIAAELRLTRCLTDKLTEDIQPGYEYSEEDLRHDPRKPEDEKEGEGQGSAEGAAEPSPLPQENLSGNDREDKHGHKEKPKYDRNDGSLAGFQSEVVKKP